GFSCFIQLEGNTEDLHALINQLNKKYFEVPLKYSIYDYGDGKISCQLYGDRKSTRLNSSHVSISYAVFCLKKKKQYKKCSRKGRMKLFSRKRRMASLLVAHERYTMRDRKTLIRYLPIQAQAR